MNSSPSKILNWPCCDHPQVSVLLGGAQYYDLPDLAVRDFTKPPETKRFIITQPIGGVCPRS